MRSPGRATDGLREEPARNALPTAGEACGAQDALERRGRRNRARSSGRKRPRADARQALLTNVTMITTTIMITTTRTVMMMRRRRNDDGDDEYMMMMSNDDDDDDDDDDMAETGSALSSGPTQSDC